MAEDTKVETEQEITADDLVATPQSDAGQTEQAETQADKPFDKVRQQVQQEIGNKVRPLEAKIDALLAKIDAQGGNATPAQQREVEKLAAAKDELDEFEQSDPHGLGVLAKRLKKYESERTKEREVWERKLADAENNGAQARQLAFEHNWKSEFARINPDLKDQAEQAFADYSKEWSDLVEPGERLPDATAKRIATKAYQTVLARLQTAKPEDTAEPAKTPEPPKSTRGTQIATGSSARRTVDNKKEPSDDELIAGFFNDPNA